MNYKKIALLGMMVIAASIAPSLVSARHIGYAGTCMVVDSAAENRVDAVVAQTLDEVRNFNIFYYQAWGRDARCDELQFHVNHVTPHDRLQSWLAQFVPPVIEPATGIERGVEFVNRLEGGAVWFGIGRSGHNAYYIIRDGKRYRVPDYPTLVAWGHTTGTSYGTPRFWSVSGNIYQAMEEYFLQHFSYGGLAQFQTAPYREIVASYISTEGNTDMGALPQNAQDQLNAVGHSLYSLPAPSLGEFDWSYLDRL